MIIKKISVLIGFTLLLIFLMGLCGCTSYGSRLAQLNYESNRDSKAFQETITAVFTAFDNYDKEGLKSLFAKNVLKENPDLDKQIEAFFNEYKGPMEIIEINYSTSGGEHIEYGKKRTELHNSYDIIIEASNVRYHIKMEMFSRDDFDKGNEGIQTLNVATDEAYNSKYFVFYFSDINRGGDKPGFYYQDSTDKRDDIMWIEGRSWRYTNYDRSLTADDIRSIVEKNNDLNHLISKIGEPNCSWDIYKFYYYELENGLFAVCQLDNTTWERAWREIEKDAIVAVYIADEEENLETVWTSDTVVKLAGLYRHYEFYDRELTEEFFMSFVQRSNSLDELIEEVGPPNVDATWSAYFQISEDRFIACKYRGDDIQELILYDSGSRLHSIWQKNGEN